MKTSAAGALLLLLMIALADATGAEIFEVGPGQPYTEIEQVPWESLGAGDIVRIHWRTEHYRSKWVVARAGTAQAPITITGVLGPAQQRPVINGENAHTRRELNYWNENRGIIKIGGSSVPTGPGAHVLIENLEIRGAHTRHQFTDDNGNSANYTQNAAAIFIEHGEYITIRNCVLHDSGNGFFVANLSRNITLERSHLYGNGNVGSIFHHNAYTESLGMIYQYNQFGPLRSGALGNNLKDRSAGLVVRYNWIEDGNRQLDLVESSKFATANEPSYRASYIYGNVLLEHDGEGNRQIVHYGGDGGNQTHYRKGVMYFFHNTVVSERVGRSTLFRLSTSDERADIRNNVFFNAGGAGTLEIGTTNGTYDFLNNWIRDGYVNSFDSSFGGKISHQSSHTGEDPGFTDRAANQYRPTVGSEIEDKAGPLPGTANNHPVSMEYYLHQDSRARFTSGENDLGAFETVLENPLEPAFAIPTTSHLALALLSVMLCLVALRSGQPG